MRVGELPAELIAFLRVKFLKGADAFLLEALFRESVWREHLLLPVSQGNEEEALNAGIVRCSLAEFESNASVQDPYVCMVVPLMFHRSLTRYSKTPALRNGSTAN
mmetsp:Transcript_3594/g.6890  ORF Transcript_3594/g.6890 Transcript_3594/m.6890 type:complete len:105 (+) Transcript_3594:742-1056(+)